MPLVWIREKPVVVIGLTLSKLAANALASGVKEIVISEPSKSAGSSQRLDRLRKVGQGRCGIARNRLLGLVEYGAHCPVD